LLAGAFLGAAAELGELDFASGREFALALGFSGVVGFSRGVATGPESFELPLLGTVAGFFGDLLGPEPAIDSTQAAEAGEDKDDDELYRDVAQEVDSR